MRNFFEINQMEDTAKSFDFLERVKNVSDALTKANDHNAGV